VTREHLGRPVTAERQIGRLLIAITYLAVALLVVGVGLLLTAGISPLDGGPGLDLATLGRQLTTFDAAGFLWLGLLAVIATPISRVTLAAVAYGRSRDWSMVGIALAILAVIAIGVVTAGTGTV
jgi:uncharacterized membrane protein